MTIYRYEAAPGCWGYIDSTPNDRRDWRPIIKAHNAQPMENPTDADTTQIQTIEEGKAG